MKSRMMLAAGLAVSWTTIAAAQDSFGGQPAAEPQQQPQPAQQTAPPTAYPQQQPQQNYPQTAYPPQQQAQQPAPGGLGQQPQAPQGGGWGQQPQQPQQPQPAPGGWGQQPPQQQPGADLDQMMQMERQDYGVAATSALHNGAMHGPTPASIPGGQIVTTKGLVALVQGKQAPYFLFDVLGGPETLPGAIPAVWLAQGGGFQDQTQQQMVQMFRQGTQGKTDAPMVFYCLSTQCWMSYNAALRAINAGYKNVLWYRGGIEAWKAAGLPVQPAQQGYSSAPPQQQPQPQQQQQQGGWPQQ